MNSFRWLSMVLPRETQPPILNSGFDNVSIRSLMISVPVNSRLLSELKMIVDAGFFARESGLAMALKNEIQTTINIDKLFKMASYLIFYKKTQ